MMAADYRHIGGVENRLGRHYSRFSPFWPAASFADQSLALRKSWNAGSNRRSQAKLLAWSSRLSQRARCVQGWGAGESTTAIARIRCVQRPTHNYAAKLN